MSDLLTSLLHAIAVLGGAVGLQEPSTLLATLGAVALVGAVAATLLALVRAHVTRRPLLIAVGDRARRHAILLSHLPDASHPDAKGHTRSRAPGQRLRAV